MDWMFGISPPLRENPEFQSAVVRLAIWTFGFSYIGIGGLTAYYKVDIPSYIGLSTGYLVCCLGLLRSVLRQPVWELRRYFSLVLDVIAASLAIFLTREAISPFYLIYIWIFISASTRYERTHLIVAAAAAVISYNIVLVLLDEWRRHTFEAFFFLLLLLALPLFQYALLRKLQQARAEAERANRAKGDFLARMTHELRTPLTGVIGMAELLQSTRLDAEQHEYVHSITRSAEILAALIGDILDVSKIDAGKLTLECLPFDLPQLMQGVCYLMESQMLSKRLELILDISSEVPHQVVGDQLRIRQILLNLLGNAAKFTERGEVILQASTSPATTGVDRSHLVFAVQDTGIGIVPEKLKDIFDGFQQADHSTTRRYGGSGLGTTIARELATLMGGAVGADSEIGKGSRFWVRLPLDHIASATPEPAPSFGFRGRTALIFETNATTRRIIDRVCLSAGMECVFIEGDEQLERDKLNGMGQPPSIVIVADSPVSLDLESIAKRLQCTLAEVPILYLTYRTRHLSVRGLAGHYLNKPFHADALLDAIARILDGQEIPAGTASAEQKIAQGHQNAAGPVRVLVAEDNEISARVIMAFLGKLGFEAVRVKDGEAALSNARKHSFDIAFIDLCMPTSDGLQFTRSFRKLEKGRHLPIIALTANAAADVRKECLAAGMDGFLSKPVRQAQLKEMVMRFVPAAKTISGQGSEYRRA